jgi:putative salt-induced outer membrane protein YdiY
LLTASVLFPQRALNIGLAMSYGVSMSTRLIALVVTPLTVAALTGLATAQPAPKFEFGKADDVKDVKETQWAATAEAGVVLTTGNSRSTTVTGGLKAMRKQAKNKLAIEAAGTLARSSSLLAGPDANGNGLLSADELLRDEKDAAKNFNAKLRYDRFLTEHNSIFVAALAGADPLAGKDFTGGGQLGYARQLYSTEQHTTSGEFGYDFSYENYASADPESVQIHSARAFIGHKAKLSEDTSFDGSLEVLDNLNSNASADRLEDLRVNLGGSLSTKLTKGIAFSFSVTAKYDKVPAPFALAGSMIDPANPPETSKIDTTTKASLIVTLL